MGTSFIVYDLSTSRETVSVISQFRIKCHFSSFFRLASSADFSMAVDTNKLKAKVHFARCIQNIELLDANLTRPLFLPLIVIMLYILQFTHKLTETDETGVQFLLFILITPCILEQEAQLLLSDRASAAHYTGGQ